MVRGGSRRSNTVKTVSVDTNFSHFWLWFNRGVGAQSLNVAGGGWQMQPPGASTSGAESSAVEVGTEKSQVYSTNMTHAMGAGKHDHRPACCMPASSMFACKCCQGVVQINLLIWCIHWWTDDKRFPRVVSVSQPQCELSVWLDHLKQTRTTPHSNFTFFFPLVVHFMDLCCISTDYEIVVSPKLSTSCASHFPLSSVPTFALARVLQLFHM